MPFDKIIEEKCQRETVVNPTTCETDLGPPVVDPPSDDDRCSDPAFYDANPTLCAGYPRLVIKPEFAITESGKTVQYRTFVRVGGAENEVTSGLNYSSADLNVALVEALAGLATGVTTGITTISVSWQNLHAYAQIEVTESCGLLASNFLLLIDDSKSMGQGFSGAYPTKLAFSKAMASLFIDSVNFSKDKVAVYDFDSAATKLLAFSSDAAAAKAAVNSIALTSGKTDFYQAMTAATTYLAGQTGVKVLIVFSDGEDNGQYDALPVAKAFKESGGIIVVVATRAWGDYFSFLYKLSSAGYFLSAYQATQADVATLLPNLKTYICSGDCAPTAGTSPHAALNYTGFLNWDVIAGWVDLIGLGLWDIRPGNGLYLDMSGTSYRPANSVDGPAEGAAVGPFGLSKMRSKDSYAFVSGQTYKFSIKACAYSGSDTANSIKITIGAHLVQTQVVPVGDFVLYEFTFTPASSTSEKIVIEEISRAALNQGSLIDAIVLERTSGTPVVFLTDDFDGENPTTVPASFSYYGCISTPPGAQAADPTPPTPSVQE